MKIHQIVSEHRNDFYWIPECEHCGTLAPKQAGYHDNHYHTRVIPGIHCAICGKNRTGVLPPLTVTRASTEQQPQR